MPASTSRSPTQRERSCSVFDASAGVPAAPSSWRAAARNSASFSGERLSASASLRARRAPSTSRRQSMSTENGSSVTMISGAEPRRLPAT